MEDLLGLLSTLFVGLQGQFGSDARVTWFIHCICIRGYVKGLEACSGDGKDDPIGGRGSKLRGYGFHL